MTSSSFLCNLINTFSLIKIITCSQYTYWRYGDGNFSNSLPENHNLFSNGLLSDDPTYRFEESTNNNTIFFYPLITENNDIYVLSKNSSNHWDNNHQHVIECDESLSLLKFNQHLNERLFVLPLLNNSNQTCHSVYFYPVYHRYNNEEYVIINIYVNATSYQGIAYDHYHSILWIVNATNMHIISTIKSMSFLYDANNGQGQDLYHQTAQFIVYNQVIFQIIPNITSSSHILGNYNAFNISTGEILWKLSGKTLFRDTDILNWCVPIAIDNKIIVPMHDTLVALNVTNGEFIHDILPIILERFDYVSQPVVYNRYNLILIPCLLNNISTLYVVNGTNGDMINKLVINDWRLSKVAKRYYVSINDYKQTAQLLLSYIVTDHNTDHCDFQFMLYDMIIIEENNTVNISLNLSAINYYNDVDTEDMNFYFMDSNSFSIIGITLLSETQQLKDSLVTFWYQNMYPIITKQLDLGDDESWMKTNSISNQKYSDYAQLNHYPAVGNNHLIYFAGHNSIYAYDIGSESDKDNLIWFFVIGGGSVLLITITILLLIRSYCSYNCNCKKKENVLIQQL